LRHVVAALVLALAVTACGGGGDDVSLDEHQLVAKGDRLFHGEATCQLCHGSDLRGTVMGPPLVDERYAPSKLPDASIHDAVRGGVQQRNWTFGPMPALPHLSDDDIDALTAYVRSVQQENGIR
jgi:mono/diheme cytochrome c family protein